MCISLSQHCHYHCYPSAVTVSAVTLLSSTIVVTTLCSFSLSQLCAHFRCHNAGLIFAVTTLCSFSLSQRCAHFRCHNAVLIFAVTTLCSFSLSQRCARFRCHNAVLIFAVTTLCTSVSLSQRCGIPHVFAGFTTQSTSLFASHNAVKDFRCSQRNVSSVSKVTTPGLIFRLSAGIEPVTSCDFGAVLYQRCARFRCHNCWVQVNFRWVTTLPLRFRCHNIIVHIGVCTAVGSLLCTCVSQAKYTILFQVKKNTR